MLATNRSNGCVYVLRADEKLTAFLELAIRIGRTPEDYLTLEINVRQTFGGQVKASSITSSEVSTYVQHG
jgi:hypothetical protein